MDLNDCQQPSNDKWESLISELRITARRNGYALGVHGSLKRDIDLIAVPWIEVVAAPGVLAEDIRLTAERVHGIAFVASSEVNEMPRQKPHGRLCWVFYLGSDPYIDLAVFPAINNV